MKFFAFSFLFLIFLALIAAPTYAHCPLCTAATGSAVAAARYYGFDDLPVGTLIGAFAVSTGFWIHNFITKRKGRLFPLQLPIITILSIASTIAGLHFASVLGVSYFLGVDKLLLGTLLGSAIVAGAFSAHEKMRAYHNNRNYVPFQSIVLPLALIALIDAGMYLSGMIA